MFIFCCIKNHPKTKWLKTAFNFLQNPVFGIDWAGITELASLVSRSGLKAMSLNHLKTHTSLVIDGDGRLGVLFLLWEGLSVATLHRPVRSSSEHACWLKNG